MAPQATSEYKELKDEIVRLHIEENFKESNGRKYPENRLYADIVPWEMTNQKWDKYTGKKLKIVFQKLEKDSVTGEPVVQQKVVWNKAVPNQKIFECPISQAEEFLEKVLEALKSQ